MPPLIELHGITRLYPMGDEVVQALRGVDLRIDAGEFVAITGPSGSGKTTLMYVLGLLDRPSGGSYRIDGVETAGLGDAALSRLRNRTIGYVFQQYNLLPDLTVVENVGVGQVYAGVPPAERERRARELAARLGLGHRLGHTPLELSGGQMQRVAIARGLSGHPRLILADEPTGNLDSKTGAEIMALLRELHAGGHTIVLVTHDPSVAAQADRVVRIVDGQIVSDESRTTGPESEVGSAEASGAATSAIGAPTVHQDRERPPGAPGLRTLDSGPSHRSLRFPDLLRMAVREGLLAHKLRSFLTTLGIVFGIAAVIAMTAITEGGKRQQLDQIRQIGLNSVQVRAVELDGARLARARRANPDGLSLEDLAALREHVPGIVASCAWKDLRAEVRRDERLVEDARVMGVTGDLLAVADVRTARGRFLDDADERAASRVCVLGADVAVGLDLGDEPLGRVVVVGDEPFTVVGVMERRAYAAAGVADLAVRDRNKDCYIPYATLRAFFRKADLDSRLDVVSLRMAEEDGLLAASELVRRIIADRNRGADDAVVAVPLEQIRQAQRTKEIFNVIIVVIAAMSLVVGGIGIMNIMLATVTERTREIGIRRAVGASQRDILSQFLAEALVLAALGGVTGLAVGVGGGWLVELVCGFGVAFDPAIMVVAVAVSGGIGVVFGLYPAWLAARMDPVEALRS